jgi:Transmembrane exosortase (Exosortase_EpsH)
LSVSGLTLLRLGVVPWTRVAANLSLIWIAWPWPAAIHQRIDGGVHRLGIQTATAVFDLVGIPVFSVGNVLEFRSQTLDTTVWMNGPDSFLGFLLFAALTLVWLRRGLVQSLLTVLSIPLIAWVGELAKILLWYWAYHDFAVDLSVGWSLVFFRVGIQLVNFYF